MKPLNELFEIINSTKLDWNKVIEEKDGIAFVSRTSKNNGVVGLVERYNDIDPYEEGLITVSLGGTYVLSAFVQINSFYVGQNVAILKPKCEMNVVQKLFYCYCITKNRYKYSAFGREANKTLKDLIVPDLDEIPQQFQMEQIPDFQEKSHRISRNLLELDIGKWKKYNYEDIFRIVGGYYNKKPEHIIKGNIPFIGATRENNGITELYSEDDISMFHKDGSMKEDEYQNKIFNGNCITVLNNGASVGYAFYQDRDFTCSHDINILYLKDGNMSPEIAFFLITLIEMEKYRWNYGRKWRITRMQKSLIMLPSIKVDSKHCPDWKYMEKYIAGCKYSKAAIE